MMIGGKQWFGRLLLTFFCLTCLTGGLLPDVRAGEGQAAGVLFREEFTDLGQWEPLFFPKIKAHSEYRVELAAEGSVLRMASHASASALLHKTEFDVYAFPWVRWRWRVDKVYARGDATRKRGDDYPARIYVSFKFDPDQAGAWEKLKYDAVRLVYGAYPPHSSLNYVWANRPWAKAILPNPYTDRAMMIPLQVGTDQLGVWQEQAVNIVADYQRAFGAQPPTRARIAVMNDADDTGDSSVSWLDFIEVSALAPATVDRQGAERHGGNGER